VLRSCPEEIGQALFAVFARRVLDSHRSGLVLRELYSGIGFVDIAVVIGAVMHLVELKIVRTGFTGLSQLETYMKTERRRQGWLLYFDARLPSKRNSIPASIHTLAGTIRVRGIDINPVPPSQKD
jgi:hypothetical protein